MTCAVSCWVCIASIVITAEARLANAVSRSRTAGISLDFASTATCPKTAPIPCARAATRCGALPALFLAPRTVLPSMAITSRPPARTALVHSQAPRARSRTSGLTRAKARRNVDSSAAPRTAPSTASASGPASAAHCPIAANDFEPAITAAIPTASSPASGCRRPRFLRGSGTWALTRRAERRERLAAARDRLVAEDQARRDAQRAKQEAWDTAAAAGKRGGRRPGDEPPRPNRNNTEPRANITDPDVRVMRNQKGYVAGYNGQLVVTADQVIVGAMLSQHPVDRTLLHPLLDQCRDQLAEAGIEPKLRTVLADSGYVSEDNFARADTDGLRLLAPLAKDPGLRHHRTPKRARHLDRFPATARAKRRLRHPRGRDDYKLRARTVEPVFGQLKTCQKLTMMSRRGLAACENEWLLACAAHNLRQLHRHRLEG